MNRRRAEQLPDVHATPDVQRFYESYPYPPPLDNLGSYQRVWQDAMRRRADHHLHWPARPFGEKFSILIAGCGTSQAAKHALRWPAAQVTGIDFSATSVSATEELKRKHKLDNLHVRQLPIERVGELGATFDQIVCTGVLHHLPDPDAGLRALRTVLAPDGAMQLMVYAPYGRTGIYLLQEFCRRVGMRATDDDIRGLVAALKALPPGHPLEKLLRDAPDFGHEAAIADALLHPQDRAYSVPEFFDFLDRAQLSFGRWLKQAPYTPECGVMAGLPQAPRISRLPRAEQYAAAELFRGTMLSHSAIVYRRDNPAPQQVSFAADAWLGYVPLRMSDTMCIQDRLPPGAAAVLLYPAHTYTDLVMPIDATELSLLEGIDGHHSVGDIIEQRLSPAASRSSSVEIGRRLFQRLWWYDQVVFDTSRAYDTGK